MDGDWLPISLAWSKPQAVLEKLLKELIWHPHLAKPIVV
jgi:hypothetical protein